MTVRALSRACLFTALLLVPAFAWSAPALTEAKAERQADGQYKVTWKVEPAGSPVDVWVAASPDAKPPAMIRLSTADRDGGELVKIPGAMGRPYFLVRAEGGAQRRTAERELPLEGGRNFRDLGGYATRDGKTVRWGRAFRSGVMTGLTENDYAYLSSIRIRTVCDFRSADERKSEPTDWKAGEVSYVAWDREQNMGGFREIMASGMPSAAAVKAMFAKSYADMPEEFATQYQEMFQRLAGGEIPLAFNCSAGKDRTGVAAALLLSALGVPRETVVADYALSDKIVNYEAAMMNGKVNAAFEQMQRIPAEVRAPLMASDPDYIKATLDALDRKHGGVENYLRQRLGITDAQLAKIRGALLE